MRPAAAVGIMERISGLPSALCTRPSATREDLGQFLEGRPKTSTPGARQRHDSGASPQQPRPPQFLRDFNRTMVVDEPPPAHYMRSRASSAP